MLLTFAYSFNIINLGFEGYKSILEDDLANARIFSRALEASGYYEVLSDIHHPVSTVAAAGQKVGAVDETSCLSYMPGLPVVAFRWTDDFKKQHPSLEQRWMQTLLRVKGWIGEYSLVLRICSCR